uniref:VIT domain-containing protein n=1 Tax=Florenciella parvula TaxID=236787 RepID=A0A6T7G446_9STRA
MADQLTEEQIAEFQEAFLLFAGSGRPTPGSEGWDTSAEERKHRIQQGRTLPEQGGLFGAPVVATPIVPVVATPVGDEDEDEGELGAAPTPLSPQRQFPLPLKDAACDIKMVNGLAKYECAYTFVNEEDGPLECTFFFPKQPHAAVTGLVVEITDADGKTSRTIRGVVQEKKKAQATYDAATHQGKTAVLVTHHAVDVTKLAVGRLRPGATAAVRVVLVYDLPTDHEGGYRVQVPSLVDVNRYPLATHGERLTWVDARTAGLPYRLSASFTMGEGRLIQGVTSPTHQGTANGLRVEALVDGPTRTNTNTMRAWLPEGARLYTGTVVLTVAVGAAPSATLSDAVDGEAAAEPAPAPTPMPSEGWWASDPAGGAAVIRLSAEELQAQAAQARAQAEAEAEASAGTNDDNAAPAGAFEIVFVLDRSGSMGGVRMKKAQESLQLFLRSLPEGCYFNVVGFGSTFEVLFDEGSVMLTDETLDVASAHADSVQADLGGTNVHLPLQYVLEQPPPGPGAEGEATAKSAPVSMPKRVFVITDGAVSDTTNVLELVQQHCVHWSTKATTTMAAKRDVAVFSLGIGAGASVALVEGVAERGNGLAEVSMRFTLPD